MMNGSRNDRWLEAKITGPLRDVLAADAREPEVQVEERLDDRPRDPVHDRVHAPLARTRVQAMRLGLDSVTVPAGRLSPWGPARSLLVTVDLMAFDRTRTLRGALAGGAAAGVWLRAAAARQARVPLAVRRRRGARAADRAPMPAPARCCTCRTARCSAPCTPTSRPPAGAPGAARPARGAPRAPDDVAADRAVVAPEMTRARGRSRSPPGATCCSASCSASSSGG